MVTPSTKRKKFSFGQILSVILAVLPQILTILNDADDSNAVSIGLTVNPQTGGIRTSVSKSDEISSAFSVHHSMPD